ncbi:peptidyl-prolyl cis-trans isomerase D [Onishia taeanensis]|uniref:Periplasmic chaperone PpiD n=1 Tax=Onishia taeanensis TaxID=284577 RepID=A0A328XN57_9GAMM|nr:SurA N-terminal domain-containing protein [Halomonas taeanensis]RAR59013.1 peptidyl-prolyl cis-trans isomerase D [Halomonas taeanensis]
MLQRIRDRSTSWGAKIIIGAVIATMALFGVDSLVGLLSSDGDDVATVNGQSITRQQVEVQVQRAIRSGQVPPEQERQLRGQVIDQLIRTSLLDQYVEEGGLHLSESQLDKLIVSLPEFQDQDGNFSRELFKNRLASAGYTPLAFRAQLRNDMQRQQLQQGLSASEFMLDDEQQRLAALQNQTRRYRYQQLNASDLEETPQVSEADLEAYYQNHRDDYQRPEQVKLAYLVLDRRELADQVEVDDAQLRSLYAERASNAERRVSHIMLTFGDQRSREEAVARLDKVKERLAAGESFASLAKEVSDDTSTSDSGGDLGVISRGFFGEAFENAVYSLDQGQVSDIVETDNGLHLLKVTEIEIPSFDELRSELRDQAAMADVDDLFNERVQQLIDESFAADDLASIATDVGAELQASDWVSADGAQGVLSEPGVMDAAFTTDVLEEGFNSEVIELDDDRRLVLRVRDHRPATTLALDEVRERVTAAVEKLKVQEALTALAEERVAALRDGSVEAVDWQQVESATRQNGGDVPAAVNTLAFRLPNPEGEAPVYGQTAVQNGVALVALDAVQEGDTSDAAESRVAQLVERLRAQATVSGLLEQLRNDAEIERL